MANVRVALVTVACDVALASLSEVIQRLRSCQLRGCHKLEVTEQKLER